MKLLSYLIFFMQIFNIVLGQCIRHSSYCSSCSTNCIQNYNCPLPIPDQNGSYAYSDSFVRTRVLPLIGASYSENCFGLQRCLDNNIRGMQLVKRYEVECDVLKYLYENFFFATYSQKDFEAGGKVLTYWHDAFYCLWNSGISQDLQQLIREYPDYELWVFGHSLGGVLASLSTMVIINRGIFPAERIKYISFGEPRIGNVVFAESFDNLVPYKYRIVREHDLITNQPPKLGFMGCNSFFHHRYEVWYPNKMLPCDPYIICQGAEDPRCSDSGLDLTGNTHLEYFGVDLLEWHKSGCAKCCTICPGRK